MSDFLLELGTGFAFVGKQVHLNVGGEDFYIDLLFYHIRLHCYVVIELKTTDFKPEHLGQLGFYITAVDGEVADWSVDEGWWCFTKGGEAMMTGAEATKIADGDVYEITYTVGFGS